MDYTIYLGKLPRNQYVQCKPLPESSAQLWEIQIYQIVTTGLSTLACSVKALPFSISSFEFTATSVQREPV